MFAILGAGLIVLGAIIRILMTPWPWLVLGAYTLYILVVKGLAAHRRRRASLAVLEVVAAQLDQDEPRLQQRLARLARYAGEDAEAAFLLAAHHTDQAKFDLALAVLKPLEEGTVPIVSRHSLVLQFPGLSIPLTLADQPSSQEAARRAREQILLLVNAPERVFDAAHPPSSRALAAHLQTALERAETRAREDAAERRARKEAAEERARVEAAEREGEEATRTMAKIKAAKTPAGRRSALQDGLGAVSTPALRQQLLLEAARADVDAVLVKVSALKTAKAKRRHLEDALAALRADVVPDEFQAQEIALLEQSLAALGST